MQPISILVSAVLLVVVGRLAGVSVSGALARRRVRQPFQKPGRSYMGWPSSRQGDSGIGLSTRPSVVGIALVPGPIRVVVPQVHIEVDGSLQGEEDRHPTSADFGHVLFRDPAVNEENVGPAATVGLKLESRVRSPVLLDGELGHQASDEDDCGADIPVDRAFKVTLVSSPGWSGMVRSVAFQRSLVFCTAALISAGAASCTGSTERETVNVHKAFVQRLNDPEFGSHAQVSGSMSIGPQTGSISGSADVDGPDSRFEMTFELAGAPTTVEMVTIGSESYERENDGPWVRTAETDDSGELGEWLTTVKTVEDRGVETVDGRRLHHLAPSAPPSPQIFGLTEADIADASVTADFYADDRGRPVILVFTLAGAVAGVDVEMEFRMEFAGPPGDIVTPQDVWPVFSSERFDLSIGYPTDWSTRERADFDVVQARSGFPRVFLWRDDKPRGLTDAQAPGAFVRVVARSAGVRPENVESYTANDLGGLLATFQAAGRGGASGLYFAGVCGDDVCQLMWQSMPGSEAEDRGTFEDILGTLAVIS